MSSASASLLVDPVPRPRPPAAHRRRGAGPSCPTANIDSIDRLAAAEGQGDPSSAFLRVVARLLIDAQESTVT